MTQAGTTHLRPMDLDSGIRKRTFRPSNSRRPQSCSPSAPRFRNPAYMKKIIAASERRCQSLSPSAQVSRRSLQQLACNATECISAPEAVILQNDNEEQIDNGQEKALPQSIVTKLMRTWATKKREFLKLKKSFITQQNTVLEYYASLKELESRAGIVGDESLGEVRVVSVTSWPPHDLLLLVRDDLKVPLNSEISGHFGPQVLQKLDAQLNRIPEEVLGVAAEVMARRIELLNFLREKHRCDRASYHTNLEWKSKNAEFDQETERLHSIVAGTAENLKAKINYSLELAKIPWLDREEMAKKLDRLQRENSILQHKFEEITKKDGDDTKTQQSEAIATYQTVCEDLAKERAAREALKDVVTSAENMLRVARARIATLERQLKEARAELEATRAKNKDLDQLVNRLEHSKTYRHRETSYDARSKKLLEVSKTGEITIEALTRQRDALELRVKELREQAKIAEHAAEVRESGQRSRVESLQAKVAEQDKNKAIAESRIMELENRIKELEERLQTLRERSVRLADMERRRCLEFVPTKESEPSDRETEIWKELQDTRLALSRAEDELRQSRADKDNFMNSLSRIAQGGDNSLQSKMGKELLEREQKIETLQRIIDEQKRNLKNMEKRMTQYENQLSTLRLEVKRLRNYDCYFKEIPNSELETELLELHMQVETISRERAALVTSAASRALMLERYEKSADLFSQIVRTRREIAALLDGRTEPPLNNDVVQAEASRSLSSVCASAADTWSALRAERERVLRLESTVVAQSLQLEKESCIRTQLEQRRTILERELLRERTLANEQCE